MPDTRDISNSPVPAGDSSWRSGEWRHGRPRVFVGILLMIAGILLTLDRLGLFASMLATKSEIFNFFPKFVC